MGLTLEIFLFNDVVGGDVGVWVGSEAINREWIFGAIIGG